MNYTLFSPTQKNDENGAIVVIVLIMLAALSFLAVELSRETLVNHSGSAYVKSTIVGNSLADSGRLLAKKILATDMATSEADYQFETWGYFDKGLQIISTDLASGVLSGSISDENALFPINKIISTDRTTFAEAKEYRAILLRILTHLCDDLEIKTAKPEDYLASIRLWQGEKLSGAAADDNWYKNRQTDYCRPERALISPDELLLIHWPNAREGNVEKLYYGTEEHYGLRDIITVWGNGPINMNTAHNAVIKALPADGKDKEEYVTAVNQYRNDPANNFKEAWYLDSAQFREISPKGLPEKALSFKSDTFRVRLKTTVGGGEKRELVIFKRENGKVKTIISFGE